MKQGRPVWGVLFCVTLFIASVAAGLAGAGGTAAQAGPIESGMRKQAKLLNGNVLRITRADRNTVKEVAIEVGRAIVVETDEPVRDVMVSNPAAVDAVVHTSKRVHIIANNSGLSNVMLYGHDGRLLVTLSVSNQRVSDLKQKQLELEALIENLIPSSRVKVLIIKGAAAELAFAAQAQIGVSGNVGSVGGKLNVSVQDDLNVKDIVFSAVLTGEVKTPADSARAARIAKFFMGDIEVDSKKSMVLNLLKVADREQVMLKVTIAEVNRNIVKQLGIDLSAELSSGGSAFSVLTQSSFAALGRAVLSGGEQLVQPGYSYFDAGLGSNVYVDPVYETKPYGFNFSRNSGSGTVSKTLRAMEQNGLARILAEPNLTAISGETANFLAGGEFPIPVRSNNGSITVEYKKFGVGLAFTPVALSEGLISLKIETEASELSAEGAVVTDGIAINGIKLRRAKTTIELPSGGSLVMAGLISSKSRQAMSGMPGVMNLPILGTLFRSRDFVKEETELVIIVTPYMVKPVNRAKLARPDDGFAPASDAKANFLGQLNRVYGGARAAEVLPDGYKGDVGFIIE